MYCSSTLADDIRTVNHACALPVSYCSNTLGLTTGEILKARVRAECATVSGLWSDPSAWAAGTETFAMP